MTVQNGVQEITEVLSMQTGGRVVYHIGFLFSDRGSKSRSIEQQSVNETANIAWKLYKDGKVSLTQRRLGDLQYEYIATRNSPNARPPVEPKKSRFTKHLARSPS